MLARKFLVLWYASSEIVFLMVDRRWAWILVKFLPCLFALVFSPSFPISIKYKQEPVGIRVMAQRGIQEPSILDIPTLFKKPTTITKVFSWLASTASCCCMVPVRVWRFLWKLPVLRSLWCCPGLIQLGLAQLTQWMSGPPRRWPGRVDRLATTS